MRYLALSAGLICAGMFVAVSTVSGDQQNFSVPDGSVTVQRLADNGDNIGIAEEASFHEDDPAKPIGRELVYYFRKSGETEYRAMPVLDGFTSAFAYDLSETGAVVGASTRPAAPGRGGSLAVVWNTSDNTLESLPLPSGHVSSRAISISADGTMIAGVSISTDGYFPAVWTKSSNWKVTLLPHVHPDNPYLAGAGGILVSDDGTTVYAPLTYEKIFEAGMVLPVYRSATYRFTREGNDWKREKIYEHALQLSDSSNSGYLTGTVSTSEGTRGYRFSTDTGLQILPIPGDSGNSTAAGVNEAGVVVGSYDDGAPEGGPVALRWKDSKVDRIVLRNARFSIAFDVNNAGAIAGLLEPPFEDPSEDHTDGFILKK